MFRFSNIVKIQGENGSVIEKIISEGKEMNENINDTENETECASVKDPLSIHRISSNGQLFFSQIPNITNEENFIIVPGQRKIPVLILSDEFCEDQAFSCLFTTGHLAVLLLGMFQ